MADNDDFRTVLVGIDHQRDISFVYTALAYGLSREDFKDSLDFYFGGDKNQYEHVLELWDETVDERVN